MTDAKKPEDENAKHWEARDLPAFADLMDNSKFEAALGVMRGAFAELEADGYRPLMLADACVIAASQKVRDNVSAVAWLAWVERQRDDLDATIRDADRMAARIDGEKRKTRLN